MPEKILDEQGVATIVELSEQEMLAWRKEFGAIRGREVLPPAEYIDKAVEALGGQPYLSANVVTTTKLILDIRETAWQIYTAHEQLVCGQAMRQLLQNNTEARSILSSIITRDGVAAFTLNDETALMQKIAAVIGEVNGRTFPYIYELAKSITQSRRSRAGKAFERIIRHIIDAKGFPCDDQSRTGTAMFAAVGLGKIVDGLLPSIEGYQQNRAKCAILTMKTTLRERWQEVVEELERTKVPHIYLLTLDDAVNDSNLDTMKSHNITLVAPNSVQQANPSKQNLISFERLFNEELPHLLAYWDQGTNK